MALGRHQLPSLRFEIGHRADTSCRSDERNDHIERFEAKRFVKTSLGINYTRSLHFEIGLTFNIAGASISSI